MDTSLNKLRELVMDREAWPASVHGVAKSWRPLSDWTELNGNSVLQIHFYFYSKVEVFSGSICCSVAQSCPTLCDPVGCSTPGFPVHHQLPELVQTYVHWVGDAIQPSHPLLSPFFLSSIFPSIRIFSNRLSLHIRWPKYWIFSFSISPSNEYSGLISFRIYWFDLLAVQGTLILFQHYSLKASILWHSSFLGLHL